MSVGTTSVHLLGKDGRMAHDLVIRNGTVVDGSGFGSYRADVGVTGDRIAEIGRVRERGRREIDAEGHVVTPGFIDGHTHMDAQVFWDATGCQLVLARRHLGGDGQLRLHPRAGPRRRSGRWSCATSSGPRTSTRPRWPRGIDWTWETFPEYLDAVDRLAKGINFAAQIGHSALRTWAMGERAFEEEANEDDLALMSGQLDGCDPGRGHRLLDLAQRAPRDVRRPPRGLAAGIVGRGGGPGRRHGPARAGHLRGRRRGMSAPDPAVRADALDRMRDLAADHRRADDLRPGRHQRRPSYLLDFLDDAAAARRPDDRPDPLPGHLGPALLQDPAAVRPRSRPGRTSGALPLAEQLRPWRTRDLRQPLVEAAIRADYAAYTGVGAHARPPDFDGIRVYRHGLPPNPSVADIASQRGVHPAEAMIDLASSPTSTNSSSNPASTPRTRRCCCGPCVTRAPS